jgi:hypothetical protein
MLAIVVVAGCVREGRETPPQQFVLEVAAAPGGLIVSEPAGISCGVVCRASFVRGAVVTLMARPHPGVKLVEWGSPCSGKALCTLAVREGVRVEARFALTDGAPVPGDFRPPMDLDGDGVHDDVDLCPVEAASGGDGCP